MSFRISLAIPNHFTLKVHAYLGHLMRKAESIIAFDIVEVSRRKHDLWPRGRGDAKGAFALFTYRFRILVWGCFGHGDMAQTRFSPSLRTACESFAKLSAAFAYELSVSVVPMSGKSVGLCWAFQNHITIAVPTAKAAKSAPGISIMSRKDLVGLGRMYALQRFPGAMLLPFNALGPRRRCPEAIHRAGACTNFSTVLHQQ